MLAMIGKTHNMEKVALRMRITELEAARERVEVDQLWDSLRAVACITKPHTDAKTIVQLRRADVVAALARLQTTR